jgi:hypothetical protein
MCQIYPGKKGVRNKQNTTEGNPGKKALSSQCKTSILGARIDKSMEFKREMRFTHRGTQITIR